MKTVSIKSYKDSAQKKRPLNQNNISYDLHETNHRDVLRDHAAYITNRR
jgi:hypothetical protein